jgi:hypothetical protein
MTWSPEALSAAMAKVSRDPYWRPAPWMYSSLLRPSAPAKPPPVPQRLSAPVSRDIVADPIPEYPQAISKPVEAAESLGGITMRLDISVWRLPHLWRLVVSLVARRLGR